MLWSPKLSGSLENGRSIDLGVSIFNLNDKWHDCLCLPTGNHAMLGHSLSGIILASVDHSLKYDDILLTLLDKIGFPSRHR